MFCILCIISFFPPAELQISFLLVHHHGSKMLRSESNSSITQSPIGWQISHLLSLLHEPTSGMCVCTSECVLPVLVCSSGLSGHHEWHSHKPALTRLRPVFHACSSFCVSHITCCYFVQRLYSRKWAFFSPWAWKKQLWAELLLQFNTFAWENHLTPTWRALDILRRTILYIDFVGQVIWLTE